MGHEPHNSHASESMYRKEISRPGALADYIGLRQGYFTNQDTNSRKRAPQTAPFRDSPKTIREK